MARKYHSLVGARRRSRIVTEALKFFAARGIKETSLQQIANAAGVSPQIIIYYFGSKQGLLDVCDNVAAAKLDVLLRIDLSKGLRMSFNPSSAGQRPLLAYLALRLPEGSPTINKALDKFVRHVAKEYARASNPGASNPLPLESHHATAKAIVMVMLGQLVLYKQIIRSVGINLTRSKKSNRYMRHIVRSLQTPITSEKTGRPRYPVSSSGSAAP